jgi:hypothetical protein
VKRYFGWLTRAPNLGIDKLNSSIHSALLISPF